MGLSASATGCGDLGLSVVEPRLFDQAKVPSGLNLASVTFPVSPAVIVGANPTA